MLENYYRLADIKVETAVVSRLERSTPYVKRENKEVEFPYSGGAERAEGRLEEQMLHRSAGRALMH